jgi:hypothetical protein
LSAIILDTSTELEVRNGRSNPVEQRQAGGLEHNLLDHRIKQNVESLFYSEFAAASTDENVRAPVKSMVFKGILEH